MAIKNTGHVRSRVPVDSRDPSVEIRYQFARPRARPLQINPLGSVTLC